MNCRWNEMMVVIIQFRFLVNNLKFWHVFDSPTILAQWLLPIWYLRREGCSKEALIRKLLLRFSLAPQNKWVTKKSDMCVQASLMHVSYVFVSRGWCYIFWVPVVFGYHLEVSKMHFFKFDIMSKFNTGMLLGSFISNCKYLSQALKP